MRLRLLENPDADQPTCAALVQMGTIQEANDALVGLNGRRFNPPLPPMHVKYAGAGQVASDNLYVSSLPRTITEDQIREVFCAHGDIVRVRLLTQPGRAETHAMVQMATPQMAAAAL